MICILALFLPWQQTVVADFPSWPWLQLFLPLTGVLEGTCRGELSLWTVCVCACVLAPVTSVWLRSVLQADRDVFSSSWVLSIQSLLAPKCAKKKILDLSQALICAHTHTGPTYSRTMRVSTAWKKPQRGEIHGRGAGWATLTSKPQNPKKLRAVPGVRSPAERIRIISVWVTICSLETLGFYEFIEEDRR